MNSYTLEFASGQVYERRLANDDDAITWAQRYMAELGHYRPVSCEWGADGLNDDDMPCYRMLFWSDDEASDNDSGVNSICQLCVVR